MLIREITSVRLVNEAAPGSFGSQAAIFAQELGKQALQGLLPGAATGTSSDLSSDQGQQLTSQVVTQLATQNMEVWKKSLYQLMQQSGTVSFDDLPMDKKQDILDAQVANLVSNMVGTKVSDIASIRTQLARQNSKLAGKIQPIISELESAVTAIAQTEPNKQNQSRVIAAWNQLVTSASTLAQAAKTTSIGSGGQEPITINGQPFDPNNPKHMAILKQKGISS